VWTQFGQPPPRVAGAVRSVSGADVSDELDVDILISRPMTLKIVEEGRPVERQSMLFEVLQRKRKAVVDANVFQTLKKWRLL
jgi:hypothetical protein